MTHYLREGQPRLILIFGTGRGANTARRYFQWDTPHQVVGYVVDREFQSISMFNDCRVVTVDEAVTVFPPEDVLAFVPLGAAKMNQLRAEKYALLKSLGYRFVSYVHSSNKLEGRCDIGENCFILENQSINFDVMIGDNVVVWSGCQIGDRSRIGDHVFMGSHVVINGDAEIGDNAYLGSNCTVSNGVHVAPQSFIGANALISQNTSERAVHIVEPTPAAEIDSLRFMRLIRGTI
jgi:sugar O-acyltransferase (sialic acid O-acetyltransferase NeuD family)